MGASSVWHTAIALLRGTFLLADWVLGEEVSAHDYRKSVQPVIDGMLMPEIKTRSDYAKWFEASGYELRLTEETRQTLVRGPIRYGVLVATKR